MLLALLALPILAQGEAVHGADSVFASPGIGIVWSVLRAPTEERTLVALRAWLIAREYA